jgi:hypothetical protein
MDERESDWLDIFQEKKEVKYGMEVFILEKK